MTPDRERLMQLAERVERAEGPSREMDAAVHEAITTFPARVGGVGWPKGALVVPLFPGWGLLPAYTASLDAAMSLYVRLPERIPSNPRLAVVEALYQHAEEHDDD